MEKVDNTKFDWKSFLFKYIPIIVSMFLLLCIGLSFIGDFIEIRLKTESGEKIDTAFKLGTLLFSNQTGLSVQIFFILLYIVFPIIGCILLFFGKKKEGFYVGSLLIFLTCAITAILSKDVFATALKEVSGNNYSVHDTYFCYMLPIIALFIATISTLLISSKNLTFTVKDITEMGIFIALALVLNFVKIVQLGATGGSINFQILPLFILALRKGPLKGFIASGIVYGLISCITDGYGIATFPFDYLLGFGSTCIIGFFTPYIFSKQQKTYNFKGELFILIGALLATSLRFIGGVASSMVVYGYNFEGAAIYNVLYIYISGAIAAITVMAVYGPFIAINNRFPSERKIEEEITK